MTSHQADTLPQFDAKIEPSKPSSTSLKYTKTDQSFLDNAVWHLVRTQPQCSAYRTLWPWQFFMLIFVSLAFVLGQLLNPALTLTVTLAVLVLPFLCVVALRAFALWNFLITNSGTHKSSVHYRFTGSDQPPASNQNYAQANSMHHIDRERTWPTYAVLIPLLKEAHVVPWLLQALNRLDYPKHKLEISFIVEAFDIDTRHALEHAHLPPHMRIVIVPDGEPRTKPRALNYALQTAVGEYVVIYDAEDVPEPDQLRRAVRVLEENKGDIGCVQARLNVYNPHNSWFTRQFTLEYSALFDAILPALYRLKFPIPLGGTSNHFPRCVLEDVGAWDPFNVTEDADLGFRLARNGWKIEVLDSATWEEAPQSLSIWTKQRTRWLKGWMQTFLVHMRHPSHLARELGFRKTLGLQILLGGLLLSAFVHPWFYLLLAAEAVGTSILPTLEVSKGSPTGNITSWLFFIGMINLLLGYLTAIALGALTAKKRGHLNLAAHGLTLPIYWLLISFAAYRALWQLFTTPHSWEKTEHSTTRPPGHY